MTKQEIRATRGQFLTTLEVCQRLGLTPADVRKLIGSGKLQTAARDGYQAITRQSFDAIVKGGADVRSR
jgi:hypothetical protein